jgi:hypothetical protein
MINKFAIFNPTTGTYTMASSEQERNEMLAKLAWDTYLYHTNGSPFSNVLVSDDGTEQWSAPNGDPISSPAEIAAQIDQWMAAESI